MKPKTNIIAAITMQMFITPLLWAETIQLKVNGMVCAFCAQGIKKNFLKQPEVKHIEVKLEDHRVSIKTHPDRTLSDNTIRTILTDAGYSVQSIERVPESESKAP